MRSCSAAEKKVMFRCAAAEDRTAFSNKRVMQGDAAGAVLPVCGDPDDTRELQAGTGIIRVHAGKAVRVKQLEDGIAVR